MTKTILELFLIGHVLGDFYLQSQQMAKEKDKSFVMLLKHSGVYLLTMIIVIIWVFQIEALKWAILLSVFHFGIDFIKYIIKKKRKMEEHLDTILYLVDQITHVLSIVLMVLALSLWSLPIHYSSLIQFVTNRLQIDVVGLISWILVLLTIAKPFSITIKKVLYPYRPSNSKEKNSVPSAGALIGILERCIILLMLSVNQYAAIGFVLTAKSVARYNKIAEDPKFSEYYLLGTLLSAMLVIGLYLLIF